MRRSAAAVVSVAWFVLVGGTFACLLPYLLNEWHFHRPLPYWAVAQAAGGLLICAGLVPLAQSFVEFIKAGGSPMPLASPPHLVVSGFYRYVRNPIYVAFWSSSWARCCCSARQVFWSTPRWPGASGRAPFAGTRSPLWPADSEPTIRVTGAPCMRGCPDCIPGPRPS
jgi:protein-S-isoprenylcysteine O-methyltransferase Ste14